MGTTDGNGVYTPDLDEEGWDPELATNFDLFSQNITDQAAHEADTTAAHAASAVSFTPTGTVAATDVQAAIAEVASEAAAAGAPTTADYLVGTTQGGLSAEIVVGATPGGELGGTWASPTVDATHSGSAHHAAATEGTGIDISGQVISVDLSEISAGGELGGTMDAPTVDSSHAGGTHAATQAAAEATAATAASTHAAAADPHTGYQKESEKAAASGYASLDGSTKVPVAQLPTGTSSSTVALGDAAAGLITTHEAAGDPHTGYQKESEKAAASGYASLDGSTKIPLAQVPTGTSSSTVALGDAAAALDATHAAAADPHTGYRLESATIGTSDITNDAVTYAKIQNVSATSRVLGRVTAGAGDTEELTGTQVASLLPSKLVGTRTSVSSAISTTETVMVSGTIPANTLAAGDTFQVEAIGRGTTGVTPGTGNWIVRVGPTTLTGNVATQSGANAMIASRTDKAWLISAGVQVFTIGASGTLQGSIRMEGRQSTNDLFSATLIPFIGSSAQVAIDTTVDNLIELTFVASQAGTSATVYNASIVKV